MSGPADHPAAAMPTWLPAPACRVVVIVGPPGNGAAEHARAAAAPGDTIIDINAIIDELAGDGDRAEWAIPGMRERNARLAELADADPRTTAYVIVPAPRYWQRAWWARTLNAELLLRDPGREAALARARAEGINLRWVHQWYGEAAQSVPGEPVPATPARREGARPGSSDRGYGPSHRKMRDRLLAREPNCRMCKAEGRVTPASVLDHIKRFRLPSGEIDWKLWGDPKNHQPLCAAHHNGLKAKIDNDARPRGVGADGRPTSPDHPWNRARPKL